MSIRSGAPYADRLEDDGRVLIYEGHDVPRNSTRKPPKSVDQEMNTPSGGPTENGRFVEAAAAFKNGAPAELVHVYEKIKTGIWTYNGTFLLADARIESDGRRRVFRFRLEMTDVPHGRELQTADLLHDRMIPSAVKLAVWKRDQGRCTKCGSKDNLISTMTFHSQRAVLRSQRQTSAYCVLVTTCRRGIVSSNWASLAGKSSKR